MSGQTDAKALKGRTGDEAREFGSSAGRAWIGLRIRGARSRNPYSAGGTYPLTFLKTCYSATCLEPTRVRNSRIHALEGTMVSILIVAEVRLYREGLKLALARKSGIKVVGTCDRLADIHAAIQELRPDIILLDMLIADGVLVLDELKHYREPPKIIAIGVNDDDPEIVACAELGISGLLQRNASLDDLVTTLKCAMRGEFWCTPRATAAIAHRVANLSGSREATEPTAPLTTREMQIVTLIDHGLSNKDIARRLEIKVATVKNHVHHVLDKLQVRRRGEAVAHLRRNGLIRPFMC